ALAPPWRTPPPRRPGPALREIRRERLASPAPRRRRSRPRRGRCGPTGSRTRGQGPRPEVRGWGSPVRVRPAPKFSFLDPDRLTEAGSVPPAPERVKKAQPRSGGGGRRGAPAPRGLRGYNGATARPAPRRSSVESRPACPKRLP